MSKKRYVRFWVECLFLFAPVGRKMECLHEDLTNTVRNWQGGLMISRNRESTLIDKDIKCDIIQEKGISTLVS